MKQIGLSIVAILSLTSFCSFSFAAASEKSPALSMNQEGYFVGIGASYNSVKVDLHPSGTLNATSGFPPTGVFAGTADSVDYTQSVFAPEIQLGYFRHIQCGDWLWGLKFLYQYLQANKTKNDVYINYVDGNIDDQVTASVKTNVTNELAALAFIGHAFTNGFAYLGIGPSLFETQNSVHNINDTLSGYYVGNLNSFSNHSQWVWGGMIQAGISYYFYPTWFLDLNYSYALTERYKSSNNGSFSPTVNQGLNTGTVSFNTSTRITEQTLTVSVNKVFSY